MEYRKVEKYVDDRKWVIAKFEDLKEGDEFRLFEKNGDLVEDKESNTEFVCSSNAHACEPIGNFEISAEVKEK